MRKFKFLRGTAVVFSILAGPAMALPGVSAPVHQSIYCATREAGNPHSQYCDYIAWSRWRGRGSWDGSLDRACYFNPAYIPGECGRDARGNVLFPPNVNVY
jgi:hypothetical protein